MIEVERVKKADAAAKAFAAIRRRIDDLINEDISLPVGSIDKGELDDYAFRDGKWESLG